MDTKTVLHSNYVNKKSSINSSSDDCDLKLQKIQDAVHNLANKLSRRGVITLSTTKALKNMKNIQH